MRRDRAVATVEEGPAINNYMFSSGDWPDIHSYAFGTNDDQLNAAANYQINPRSVFTLVGRGWKNTGGVIDGTSNTIAMSEKIVPDSASSGALIKMSSAVVGGDVLAGPASRAVQGALSAENDPTRTGNPSICNGPTIRNGKYYVSGVGLTSEGAGLRWADGIAAFSTFSTILAPNGPSCVRDAGVTLRAMNTATSNHTGGVNAVRFDGSVDFISDTISAVTTGPSTYPLATAGGMSPYGVWGAIGSINGGESVSL